VAESYCDDGSQTKIHDLSFADAMLAFTNQNPTDYEQGSEGTTIDPINTFSVSDPSTTPSCSSRHDSAHASSATPKTTPTEVPEMSVEEVISFQTESESTYRARYAANRRHNRARNSRRVSHQTGSTSGAGTIADEKKRNLREKNKVAAAKCRQRQRKQAESIRAKGGRLSETNAQLSSYVQELRGELNGLRAVALGHRECDNRLARYNQVQAERVMAEYYSICSGLAGAMMTSEQAEPQ
jgi:hypothetical protein